MAKSKAVARRKKRKAKATAQPAAPAQRLLLIATDGNQVGVLRNDMGLLEAKQSLEMVLGKVVQEINTLAAGVATTPPAEPEETPPEPENPAKDG